MCDLKFRRQFPIPPFIADFACIDEKLVIEIDGGYHDYVYKDDQERQRKIEADGWTVIRFSNEEILEDVEAAARAIARRLGMETRFLRQNKSD